VSDLGASRLADLWTRHLAGESLTNDEYATLTDAFANDEMYRRRVLGDRRLDGALRALGELERRQPELLATMDQLVRAAAHSDGFVERLRLRLAAEPVARRASTRRAVLAGAAVAAVAAAFIMIPRRAPRSTAGRAVPSVAGRSISRPPADQIIPSASGARRAVLLLGGDDPQLLAPRKRTTIDEPLRARLEQLGFSVEVLTADDHESSLPRALEDADVVVLSPSVATAELSEDLVTLSVPMVALESSAFSRLGLTGVAWKRDLGPTDQRVSDVVISNPNHPLAGGLTGQPTVLQRRLGLRWGLPGEEAIVVARFPGAPAGQSAVFAYERGSDMPGGRAAARRVGIFLGNGRVIRSLTADGWRLFDAAVSWSAADSR
jgi:hypothetical protein